MENKTQKILYCTGKTADKPLVYVLRGSNGDLLIDTGGRETTHQIDRWIRRNGYQIKWIFLTHGHFDHTWNAQYFKRKFDAKVIIHENDRSLFCLDEATSLYPSSEKAISVTKKANTLMDNDYNAKPFCKVDVFLKDDDTDYLRKLGFDADVVMLHGHTRGSMGVLQGRVLYAGDAVSAIGGDYYTAMFGEDVGELYDAEKKIFELNPLIIAPGHGRPIVNEKAF